MNILILSNNAKTNFKFKLFYYFFHNPKSSINIYTIFRKFLEQILKKWKNKNGDWFVKIQITIKKILFYQFMSWCIKHGY